MTVDRRPPQRARPAQRGTAGDDARRAAHHARPPARTGHGHVPDRRGLEPGLADRELDSPPWRSTARTFQNFIGGEWVDAAGGETFESPEPGDGRGARRRSRARGPEDVDRAVAAAKEAFDDWRLVPAPKRGEILFRFAELARASTRRAHRADDARDGQGPGRGRRRRPGSDRHELLHGRRGPAAVRPDDAVASCRDKFNMSVRMPIGVVGVITPWNFPIAIPSWKIVPGARLRQHGRVQAGGGHAAARRALRRAARRGGRPGGRRQRRARLRRATSGEAHRPPPGRARRSRFTGSRETGVAVLEGRRRPAQARPPRARRQERDHRHGRRRPRPRGRGHPLVGVRHLGPALHRRERA